MGGLFFGYGAAGKFVSADARRFIRPPSTQSENHRDKWLNSSGLVHLLV
jgi:hypothetical protein